MLLEFLSDSCIDVEEFLDLLNRIADAENDLKAFQEDSEGWDLEEMEFLKDDLETWEQELHNIKHNFLKENPNSSWEKEVEKVIEEREKFCR